MPTREELIEEFDRYRKYYTQQRTEAGIPSVFEVWWAGHVDALLRLNGEEIDPNCTDWIKDPTARRIFSPEMVDKRIVEEIATCHSCELAGHRTKTVPGSGPIRSDLMLVGEAPGADEDAAGVPFVGRAGEALDQDYLGKALERTRDSVRIVNTLKCRPPQNRNPEPQELQACQHFLHRQIMLTSPKVILALGKVAGSQLTGQTIGKLRDVFGKVSWYQHIPVMVAVHPAGYVRNKQMWKENVWNTAQWIKWILAQPSDAEFWEKRE
jgi:DNA polymerase